MRTRTFSYSTTVSLSLLRHSRCSSEEEDAEDAAVEEGTGGPEEAPVEAPEDASVGAPVNESEEEPGVGEENEERFLPAAAGHEGHGGHDAVAGRRRRGSEAAASSSQSDRPSWATVERAGLL